MFSCVCVRCLRVFLTWRRKQAANEAAIDSTPQAAIQMQEIAASVVNEIDEVSHGLQDLLVCQSE